MIRVALIEDHQVVREGLLSLIGADREMEVVGGAADGRAGLQLVEEMRPDVAVMDIGMPNLNGVDATRRIARDHPATRVVALSMHTDKRYVFAMFEAGAWAYVAKDSAADELVRAIRSVNKGRKYLSPDVTDAVIDRMTNNVRPATGQAAASLSPREREILQLIAEGRTSGEIGAALHLAVTTVDTHRRNIMKKLDLHSVADLTKYAVREGLTTLD